MTIARRLGPQTAAVLVILITGVICAWPMLAGGGWLTYQDNPCHLAGLDDLAGGSGGWSDAAFLGYPLTATHGPLWYGILGRLAALGVPTGLLLALFEMIGFLAPALAVLAVSRRRAPLWAATAVAWLVLVQRPWLAGFESPLGGMASFGIAAACLVLIVGELARGEVRPARLGVLYGLLGLTHLFLILPAMLVFVLAVMPDLRSTEGRRRIVPRLAAAALGALISAPYWLPALLQRHHFVVHDLPLPPHLGLLYLLLPLHPLPLARGELNWQTELLLTDAVPMVLLVVLGLLALRTARTEPAARLGLLLAGSLALLVLVVVPWSGEPLLGPHSWRRLFLVRLALAVAAAPALASCNWANRLAGSRRAVAAIAIVLVLSGLWWQRPLRLQTPPPDTPEIAQLREVWRWLATHDPADPGRIYVQDTFFLEGDSKTLVHSHLLALTARETGQTQVGAFYGGMPFVTEDWTSGQFGQLFGRPLLSTDDLLRVGRLLPAAAVSRLLLANPQLVRKMVATGIYRDLFSRGRFHVLEPVAPPVSWFEASAGVEAEIVDRRPGCWRMQIRTAGPGGWLRLSLAWAPGWQISDLPKLTVRAAIDGRLELVELPAGQHELELRYRPVRWPWLLALVGWAGLGLLAVLRRP